MGGGGGAGSGYSRVDDWRAADGKGGSGEVQGEAGRQEWGEGEAEEGWEWGELESRDWAIEKLRLDEAFGVAR